MDTPFETQDPVSTLAIDLEDVWPLIEREKPFSDHVALSAIRGAWAENRARYPGSSALTLVVGVSMLDGYIDGRDWDESGKKESFADYVIRNSTEAYLVWERQVVLCMFRGVLNPFSEIPVELAREIREFCVPFDSGVLHIFSSNKMFTPAGLKDAVFRSEYGQGVLDASSSAQPLVVMLPNMISEDPTYPSRELIASPLERGEVRGYVGKIIAAAADVEHSGGKAEKLLVPYRDLVFLGYLMERMNVSAATVVWDAAADRETGVLGLVQEAGGKRPGVQVVVTGDAHALVPRANTVLGMLGTTESGERSAGVTLYASPVGVYVVVLNARTRHLLNGGASVSPAFLGVLVARSAQQGMERSRQREFVDLMDSSLSEVLDITGDARKAFGCTYLSYSSLRSMYLADDGGSLRIDVSLLRDESISRATSAPFGRMVDSLLAGAERRRKEAYAYASVRGLSPRTASWSRPGELIDMCPPREGGGLRKSWVRVSDYAKRAAGRRVWAHALMASVAAVVSSVFSVLNMVPGARDSGMAVVALLFPLRILSKIRENAYEVSSEEKMRGGQAADIPQRSDWLPLCSMSNLQGNTSGVVHLQRNGGDVLSGLVRDVVSDSVWEDYLHMVTTSAVFQSDAVCMEVATGNINFVVCAPRLADTRDFKLNRVLGNSTLRRNDIIMLNHAAVGAMISDDPSYGFFSKTPIMPSPNNENFTLQNYYDAVGSPREFLTVLHQGMGDAAFESIMAALSRESGLDISNTLDRNFVVMLKATVERAALELDMKTDSIMDKLNEMFESALLEDEEPPADEGSEQRILGADSVVVEGVRYKLVQDIDAAPSASAGTTRKAETKLSVEWTLVAKNDYALATVNSLFLSYLLYRAFVGESLSKTAAKVLQKFRPWYEKGERGKFISQKRAIPNRVAAITGLMGLMMPFLTNGSSVQSMLSSSVFSFVALRVAQSAHSASKTRIMLRGVAICFGAEAAAMAMHILMALAGYRPSEYIVAEEWTYRGTVQWLLDAVGQPVRENLYWYLPDAFTGSYEFPEKLIPEALLPYASVLGSSLMGASVLGGTGYAAAKLALHGFVLESVL